MWDWTLKQSLAWPSLLGCGREAVSMQMDNCGHHDHHHDHHDHDDDDHITIILKLSSQERSRTDAVGTVANGGSPGPMNWRAITGWNHIFLLRQFHQSDNLQETHFHFHFHQSDNFQETHWSQAFQMLSLRSEFQPKRSPRSAFEASPVIFPPFREEIKKVIIQRLTPVMAVIWLRSFLCCYTSLQTNPPLKKKLQKKRRRRRGRRRPPRRSPKSWRKKRRDFFPRQEHRPWSSCASTSQESSVQIWSQKGPASQSAWSVVNDQ